MVEKNAAKEESVPWREGVLCPRIVP